MLSCLGLVPVTATASASTQDAERVVSVRVHGNHSISDEEILQIAGITIGGPIGDEELAAIESRLSDSGRFDSSEVRKRYQSLTRVDEVVLILLVHEREPLMSKFLFLPIIQGTEEYGLTYGLRSSVVDLLGADERLSIPLTWGGVRRAALELEKSFNDDTLTLRSGAAILQRENPHYEINDRRYEAWLQVDRRLTSRFRLALRGGWTDVEFGDLDQRFVDYGASIQFDIRPDIAFPRDSVFASAGWQRLDFSAGAVAGEALPERPSVNQFRFELQGYKRLIGQSVLAVRGIYHVADAALPLYEKRFLGGYSTLRGYRTAAFVGDSLAIGSAELRVPLTSPMGFSRAGLSFFYDIGTVWEYGTSLSDSRFRDGVGIGVFLLAAFVQINVDVAYDLEDDVRLHFSSGFRF